MTPTLVFVLLVAFVATTSGSDDTFFILDSPDARCFQIDYPPGTVVNVDYTLTPSITGRITITGPTSSSAWSDTFFLKDSKGKTVEMKESKIKQKDTITFKSSGLTHFCFKQNTPVSSRGTIKITRGLGGHGSSGKLNLNPILSRLSTLRDRITWIINEADYMKLTEVEFHDQSVKMNSASVWWPVIQILVLLVTGIAWTVHLTSFFRKRKLV
ncbi:hypothetical protein TrLO_g1998 [Triparma laevis f. longispina]|uniref:GOLD domain-containing protein n=1 Tax=Triparma laevis f. longispina TaxID=1714387 RepID=A0A9W7E7T2_9STRA|nr:hypothetical protein TrLO_g1998 [Triparma laevis f. longispina]